MSKKVLIAGESWMSYTTHVKGFDSFTTSVYEEGVKFIRNALQKAGYEVTFLPNHLAPEKFPFTIEELSVFDCVVLSDIGSNTLLLAPETFAKSVQRPNRLQLICDYVEAGGAFLMVGGYMSFTGVDAKTRYGVTPVKNILPVKCLPRDDRQEHPEGVVPSVQKAQHPIFDGISGIWPHFLGYNQTEPIEEGEVLATIDGDPFIAVREVGDGRSAVFTSDCAPHWGPPEFVNWTHYDLLWKNIMDYLTKS